MSIQLKLCPECGHPHLLIHHWEPRREDEAESYQVECPACGFVALPANDEAGAIELWNRGDDGLTLAEDPAEDVW